MNKSIVVMSLLLVVQLGLAVTVGLNGETYDAFEPKEKLLAFEPASLDGLRIASGDSELVLNKQQGRWKLPESGDFPADQAAVKKLLDKLAALEKGWPSATTAGAARRFKVSDEAFERKLTLISHGEAKAILYIGTSPGFRKVHVRPEGVDEIYAVAFNAWEASAKGDDWIDKQILKLDTKRVKGVEMPGFTLQREGETLQLADLADNEQSRSEEIGKLVEKLAGLRIESLLGNEAKPEYQQDNPVLEISLIRDGGEPLSYRFSKPETGAYYVLKRSDLEPYFKVAEFAVKPLLEETREKLVRIEGNEKPAPTLGNATLEKQPDSGG